MNEQGVYRGACRDLRKLLGDIQQEPVCCFLAWRLLCFVHLAEMSLSSSGRFCLSTEILESSFSLYKRLEGQHSQGGFTSLLCSFAGLLREADVASVRSGFSRVSSRDVKVWVKKHLKETLASRRRKGYAEYKKALAQQNTKQ